MKSLKPMLLANSLNGFEVHATDGSIGRINDFHFDDRGWEITHLVIDLGGWIEAHKVLISPRMVGSADWRKKQIAVNLSRDQIRHGPDLSTEMPIALQLENKMYAIQQNAFLWPEMYASLPIEAQNLTVEAQRKFDKHIHSTRTLQGIVITSEDGKPLGSVRDFLIDTIDWKVNFLFIKSSDARIFIADPQIITHINLDRRTIVIHQSKEDQPDWVEYDPHHMAVMSLEG
jgi:sporulation protein YlmC with PRC-barrel domain